MAIKTFNQTFNGYYPDKNRVSIPEVSGIYDVYAGTYNPSEKTVNLRKLLYIGQAENINKRLQNHECEPYWEKELRYGEIVIFSYTKLPIEDLDRFEAAMIYHHQPPVNDKCKESFNYDTTYVFTSGENYLLSKSFIVERS